MQPIDDYSYFSKKENLDSMGDVVHELASVLLTDKEFMDYISSQTKKGDMSFKTYSAELKKRAIHYSDYCDKVMRNCEMTLDIINQSGFSESDFYDDKQTIEKVLNHVINCKENILSLIKSIKKERVPAEPLPEVHEAINEGLLTYEVKINVEKYFTRNSVLDLYDMIIKSDDLSDNLREKIVNSGEGFEQQDKYLLVFTPKNNDEGLLYFLFQENGYSRYNSLSVVKASVKPELRSVAVTEVNTLINLITDHLHNSNINKYLTEMIKII